jgi:hypothetical protein
LSCREIVLAVVGICLVLDMELLLNLAWVLLVLPAYWLWRQQARARREKLTSAQRFIALACLLVLLFPVISASDDLHAMRAEMEEPGISKRTVRATATDKHSNLVNRLQGPALLVNALWLAAPEIGRHRLSAANAPLPTRRKFIHGGRAPPFSLPG